MQSRVPEIHDLRRATVPRAPLRKPLLAHGPCQLFVAAGCVLSKCGAFERRKPIDLHWHEHFSLKVYILRERMTNTLQNRVHSRGLTCCWSRTALDVTPVCRLIYTRSAKYAKLHCRRFRRCSDILAARLHQNSGVRYRSGVGI